MVTESRDKRRRKRSLWATGTGLKRMAGGRSARVVVGLSEMKEEERNQMAREAMSYMEILPKRTT